MTTPNAIPAAMEKTAAPNAFAAWRAQYSGNVMGEIVYTIRLTARLLSRQSNREFWRKINEEGRCGRSGLDVFRHREFRVPLPSEKLSSGHQHMFGPINLSTSGSESGWSALPTAKVTRTVLTRPTREHQR